MQEGNCHKRAMYTCCIIISLEADNALLIEHKILCWVWVFDGGDYKDVCLLEM
jgi:hypothetical protein